MDPTGTLPPPAPAAGAVLHVVTPGDWARARARGEHAPSSLAALGFVHCCTPAQLPFVLGRHFPGVAGLLVLELDPARVGAPLRRERSEPGMDPFPHLYGPIPVAAVVAVRQAAP